VSKAFFVFSFEYFHRNHKAEKETDCFGRLITAILQVGPNRSDRDAGNPPAPKRLVILLL
jgi:hypothetical protein